MLNPAYKLTFGAESGGSGGILGAAAGVVGGGGNQIIDTTDEPQASTLVDLTVSLDMDAPADSYTLVLGQVGSFRPGRESQVTIELGYADNGQMTQVMVGGIVSVEPGLISNRIVGHSAAQKLLRTYVDKTFESKTTEQIVRDLAKEAGARVAKADRGITFPAYVIDGRRNVYRHMRNLADLSGFDLYVDAQGELVLEKFTSGNTVHVLQYGQHVVDLALMQADPFAGQVEAWGESSGKGSDAWAWLTKDFGSLRGTAGSGKPKLLLERSALRNGSAARTAAQAAETDIQRRTVRGRLLIAGRPQVKLGDAVRLRDVPESALNGTFQVRSVTHHLSKLGGFTTTIGFRKSS